LSSFGELGPNPSEFRGPSIVTKPLNNPHGTYMDDNQSVWINDNVNLRIKFDNDFNFLIKLTYV